MTAMLSDDSLHDSECLNDLLTELTEKDSLECDPFTLIDTTDKTRKAIDAVSEIGKEKIVVPATVGAKELTDILIDHTEYGSTGRTWKTLYQKVLKKLEGSSNARGGGRQGNVWVINTIDFLRDDLGIAQVNEMFTADDEDDDCNIKLYGDESATMLSDADAAVANAFGCKDRKADRHADGNTRESRRKRYIDDHFSDERISEVLSSIRFTDKSISDIADDFDTSPDVIKCIYDRAVNCEYVDLDVARDMYCVVAGREDGECLYRGHDGFVGTARTRSGRYRERDFHGGVGVARRNWITWRNKVNKWGMVPQALNTSDEENSCSDAEHSQMPPFGKMRTIIHDADGSILSDVTAEHKADHLDGDLSERYAGDEVVYVLTVILVKETLTGNDNTHFIYGVYKTEESAKRDALLVGNLLGAARQNHATSIMPTPIVR